MMPPLVDSLHKDCTLGPRYLSCSQRMLFHLMAGGKPGYALSMGCNAEFEVKNGFELALQRFSTYPTKGPFQSVEFGVNGT
jgi:hypothetical protein